LDTDDVSESYTKKFSAREPAWNRYGKVRWDRLLEVSRKSKKVIKRYLQIICFMI